MLSPQIPKSLFAKRKRLIIRFLSTCSTACKRVKDTVAKDSMEDYLSVCKGTIIFLADKGILFDIQLKKATF